MIPFFKKTAFEKESRLTKLFSDKDGFDFDFRRLCSEYTCMKFGFPNFFLTKSCTQSLELALLIADLPQGSEVILPSYAFVSLANAIVLRGLVPVFVDCEKETMNIDAKSIKDAVNGNTSAVITINYGGVACNYDVILPLCRQHGLLLIEDNAHGLGAYFRDIPLGRMGNVSTVSFDFLKNISCYEGGGITINEIGLMESFKIAYEFGTNKLDFLEGKAPFYEWKAVGSNHALAQPLAAILYEQLSNHESINSVFRKKWDSYYSMLHPLKEEGLIELACIPEYSRHNGHMFWIKVRDMSTRNDLIAFLKDKGIITQFHYTPLHTSEYGKKMGVFAGKDINTTLESSRLLRLPLFYDLSEDQLHGVVRCIHDFFGFDQPLSQV